MTGGASQFGYSVPEPKWKHWTYAQNSGTQYPNSPDSLRRLVVILRVFPVRLLFISARLPAHSIKKQPIRSERVPHAQRCIGRQRQITDATGLSDSGPALWSRSLSLANEVDAARRWRDVRKPYRRSRANRCVSGD